MTMKEVAQALVEPGKGILAADESTPTIKKRLDSIGVESTEETRHKYRSILFRTDNLSKYISGIILFDETFRHSNASMDGIAMMDAFVSIPQHLEKLGIIPGIKLDTGTKPFWMLKPKGYRDHDKITEGLDGLQERLFEYHRLGAKFTKWRAALSVGATTPCILANASSLARYAATAQASGLVPIVEPEVLMDGNHTIVQAYDTTRMVLDVVFRALYKQGVKLDEMILKTNMVLPGYQHKSQCNTQAIAERTVNCLTRSVPKEVPGISFLSGGQEAHLATERLDAMNKLGNCPWKLSFSFGRALPEAVLKTWLGKDDNVEAAQKALLDRVKLNCQATLGALDT